jgi:hypothetical protein
MSIGGNCYYQKINETARLGKVYEMPVVHNIKTPVAVPNPCAIFTKARHHQRKIF